MKQINSAYNTKEKNLYGNWRIYAPDGALLSITTKKRGMWYVSRGLAELTSTNPPKVQLNFEPKGRDTDSFNLQKKHNRCVVCGSTEIRTLTKHHVIPSMYRRLFPNELKNRASHDIVVICRACHDNYERNYADVLKNILADEFNCPLQSTSRDNDKTRAILIARTIIRNWDQLPGERVEEMLEDFESITGIEPNNFDELYQYIDEASNEVQDDSKKHPNVVVASLTKDGKIQEFMKQWRINFIESMKPKYMPEGWSIDGPAIFNRN